MNFISAFFVGIVLILVAQVQADGFRKIARNPSPATSLKKLNNRQIVESNNNFEYYVVADSANHAYYSNSPNYHEIVDGQWDDDWEIFYTDDGDIGKVRVTSEFTTNGDTQIFNITATVLHQNLTLQEDGFFPIGTENSGEPITDQYFAVLFPVVNDTKCVPVSGYVIYGGSVHSFLPILDYDASYNVSGWDVGTDATNIVTEFGMVISCRPKKGNGPLNLGVVDWNLRNAIVLRPGVSIIKNFLDIVDLTAITENNQTINITSSNPNFFIKLPDIDFTNGDLHVNVTEDFDGKTTLKFIISSGFELDVILIAPKLQTIQDDDSILTHICIHYPQTKSFRRFRIPQRGQTEYTPGVAFGNQILDSNCETKGYPFTQVVPSTDNDF